MLCASDGTVWPGQIGGLEEALTKEQDEHAKAVAEVYKLQKEALSRQESAQAEAHATVGQDAYASAAKPPPNSAFLNEAALLERLSGELQETIRQRDNAQQQVGSHSRTRSLARSLTHALTHTCTYISPQPPAH